MPENNIKFGQRRLLNISGLVLNLQLGVDIGKYKISIVTVNPVTFLRNTAPGYVLAFELNCRGTIYRALVTVHAVLILLL